MAQNSFQHNELDHLKRYRDALSPGAKDVLSVTYHIATTSPAGDQGQFYFTELRKKLKYDSALLMCFASELQSRGLLRIQNPHTSLPDYVGVLLTITPIGRRFVEHSNAGNI